MFSFIGILNSSIEKRTLLYFFFNLVVSILLFYSLDAIFLSHLLNYLDLFMLSVEKLFLIGVGASAGGLEALSELVSHLPKSLISRSCIIVAQHLSPNYRSMLVQILSKDAVFPVKEAENESELQAGNIYITPPDFDVQVHRNTILLSKPRNIQGPKPSIDLLFTSMAEEFKENAIGVILSGTGSDGSKGIIKIKEQGGLTIIQNPDTAKYDGMPISALQTGVIDYSLPAEKMGEKIESYIVNGFEVKQEIIIESEMETIFSLMNQQFGIDFTHYKTSTIMRRVDKCMTNKGFSDISTYIDHLKINSADLQELYDSFLINVTSFFRDTTSFQLLEQILFKKLKEYPTGTTFRIWIPGVSTGEEAFSIGFILQYLIDNHNDINLNYQIFATDIDDQALHIARKAIYSSEQILAVPEKYKHLYLNQVDRGFEVIKTIRSKILFSKHDVTVNPPFLKIDLISCRNLLIYLDNDIQRQIFPVFHYALKDSGILFLGKSESANLVNDLFDVLDAKAKLFRKRAFITHPPSLKFNRFKPLGYTGDWEKKKSNNGNISFRTRVLETLTELSGNTYLIINSALDIIETKGDISSFMQIPEGQLNLNINRLLRKEVQLEVKNLLYKVIKDKSNQISPIKRYRINNQLVYLRFSAGYLIADSSGTSEELYVLLVERIETDELESTNDVQKGISDAENLQIAELENELRITKEHLQTYIEEIETANEELQSLNEELQSSNEELQSANEELETGNEELQSSNEELQTAYSEIKHINDELIHKEIELEKSNSLFNTQFENTLIGNLLLDGVENLVLVNKTAKDLLKKIGLTGIRASLPFRELVTESFYEQIHELVFATENHRKSEKKIIETLYNQNKYYYEITAECVYSGYPYRSLYFSISILDLTELKTKEEKLHKRDEMLTSLLESQNHYLIRTDMQGRYTYVNNAFCNKFGFKKEQVLGQYYGPTVHPDDHIKCEKAIEELVKGKQKVVQFELRKPNPKGGFFETEWEFSFIRNHEGDVVEVQGVGTDITDAKQARELIQKERDQLELMIWGGRLGTWTWNIQKDQIEFNDRWKQILGLDDLNAPNTFSSWLKLIHPDDIKLVEKEITACLNGDSAFYEIEHRKKHSSGKWIWISATGKVIERDKNGKPIVVMGIHQDISEKMEAEQTLQISESRYKTLIETMTEGIVIQGLNSEVLFSNSSAEQMLGLTKDQLLGKKSVDPKWKAIKEDGSEFPIEEHPAMIVSKTGKSQTNVIMGIHKPDGELIWISINSQLMIHPITKDAYATFTVFRDITQLKKSTAQKNELIDLIQKQNKKLTEYAYITSHNLRSPIANLISLCGLVEEEENPKQYSSMIAESANQLDSTMKLMNRLLEIDTDSSHNSREDILLFDIVEQNSLLLKHLINNGFTINNEIPETLTVRTVPTYIHSIVNNMMSNALKFRKNSTDDYLTIHANRYGNEVHLSFIDNGMGMDLNKVGNKLFKINSRFHTEKDGKGIGLFFTKHQIEALNGELKVESKPDIGTKFLIIFKE